MPYTLSLFPENFEQKLLIWYNKHQRDLPWRRLKTPYAVLVSEFMLQQTTVSTVIPYFDRWMERFPDSSALAEASENDVLHHWQGLGYYSRARNLWKAAQIIMLQYNGRIPADIHALQELPGIGPYTAAAIAAIAFDQPVIPVDGNIARIYSRIQAKSVLLSQLKTELSKVFSTPQKLQHPGDFAQALMDLGATICRPTAPRCELCPVQMLCQAYQKNIVSELPQLPQRKTIPERYTWAFVIHNQAGAIYLRQRPEQGLLAKMMEVPSTPWVSEPSDLLTALEQAPFPLQEGQVCGQLTHTFTHFRLHVQVYRGITEVTSFSGLWTYHLETQALPTLMKKILKKAEVHENNLKQGKIRPKPR